MDSNSDGRVSRDEFIAFQQKNFQQIDTNADNYLSSEEVNEWQKRINESARGSHDTSREGSVSTRWSSTSSQTNPDSSQKNMHDQMFKEMDTRSDGVVTRDEFNAFGEKKFQQMDANGDGRISSDKMKAAHKKMYEGTQSSGGSSRNAPIAQAVVQADHKTGLMDQVTPAPLNVQGQAALIPATPDRKARFSGGSEH